jgi:hypothetical protein
MISTRISSELHAVIRSPPYQHAAHAFERGLAHFSPAWKQAAQTAPPRGENRTEHCAKIPPALCEAVIAGGTDCVQKSDQKAAEQIFRAETRTPVGKRVITARKVRLVRLVLGMACVAKPRIRSRWENRSLSSEWDRTSSSLAGVDRIALFPVKISNCPNTNGWRR